MTLLINRVNCALWITCLLSVTHPLPWWRKQTHPQDAESSAWTSLAVFPVNLHTAVTDHWRLSSSIAAWVTILTLLTLSARPKMALVPANSSEAARGTGPPNSTKPVVETPHESSGGLRCDPWVSRRRWRYSAERTENTQRLNQCNPAVSLALASLLHDDAALKPKPAPGPAPEQDRGSLTVCVGPVHKLCPARYCCSRGRSKSVPASDRPPTDSTSLHQTPC